MKCRLYFALDENQLPAHFLRGWMRSENQRVKGFMFIRLLVTALVMLNLVFPVMPKAMMGGTTSAFAGEIMTSHVHQTGDVLGHHPDGKHQDKSKHAPAYDCASDNCQIGNLILNVIEASPVHDAATIIAVNDAPRASADHDLHRPPKV